MSNAHPDNNPVIELFSGTLWEAEMIRSLLSDAGIESFLQNELRSTYAYNPIRAAGVKVMILASDFTDANSIVSNYLKSQS